MRPPLARAPSRARPPPQLLPPITGAGPRGVTRWGRRRVLLIPHRPTGLRLTRRPDTPHRPRARSAVTIHLHLTAAVGPGLRHHTRRRARSGAGPASARSAAVLAAVSAAGGLAVALRMAGALVAVAAMAVAVLAAVTANGGRAFGIRQFAAACSVQRGGTIRGGAGTVADRGGGATNRACPGMHAACSRSEEWSLRRDQMMNPMSLATARTAASRALNSGHQANQAADWGEPPRRKSTGISIAASNPTTKESANHGIT